MENRSKSIATYESQSVTHAWNMQNSRKDVISTTICLRVQQWLHSSLLLTAWVGMITVRGQYVQQIRRACLDERKKERKTYETVCIGCDGMALLEWHPWPYQHRFSCKHSFFLRAVTAHLWPLFSTIGTGSTWAITAAGWLTPWQFILRMRFPLMMVVSTFFQLERLGGCIVEIL